MECTDTRSRLDAYLDQELDPVALVDIERHVAACTACEKIFHDQSALKSGIRRHATYYRAPDALLGRVRAQIGHGPAQAPARLRPSMPQWMKLPPWLQFGAAMAATAMVSWMAATEYGRPSEDEVVAAAVVAGHARSLVTNHVMDVASSDQHTVKPWLSSRIDFSPPVTDLAAAGYPLVGGRLDYVANKRAAALVYKHREHLIDVFVWRDHAAGGTVPAFKESKRGYNVVHWSEGGLAFWAVSDLNAAEMRSFVDAYASAR